MTWTNCLVPNISELVRLTYGFRQASSSRAEAQKSTHVLVLLPPGYLESLCLALLSIALANLDQVFDSSEPVQATFEEENLVFRYAGILCCFYGDFDR